MCIYNDIIELLKPKEMVVLKMKKQPVGVDDFKKIVDNDLYFVDKTLLIKEIISIANGIMKIDFGLSLAKY